MNILFFCQSRSLDLFHQVYLHLRSQNRVETAGFYVANLFHYEAFLGRHPNFESEAVVEGEWDIYQQASGHQADENRIGRFEKEIGDPTLWTPLITDRRLYMGRKAPYRQDYRPQFTRNEMMAVLDIALQRIDRLFQTVKPDLVCTLYTATFGDCLAHMFAKARGIRSFDLQQARLGNYVMLVDGINDPPPHFMKNHELLSSGIPDDLRKQAEAYIEKIRQNVPMYEGVLLAPEKQAKLREQSSSSRKSIKPIFTKGLRICRRMLQQRKSPYCYDYQTPGVLKPKVYRHVINRVSAAWIKQACRHRTIDSKGLKNHSYILYPMHVEPELVLAQFARPCLNQIEVIRNISLSIPVGMTLLVKEHPLMIGRRPPGYYRKLLDIPNVMLVDWNLSSEVAVEHARMVVIIRGAIGLEAAIKKIPVVSLGRSFFQVLPECMFRFCPNLYALPNVIRDLLKNYAYDHEALLRYTAAIIRSAISVNMLELLGKTKGRFLIDDIASSGVEGHPHLKALAEHLMARMAEVPEGM